MGLGRHSVTLEPGTSAGRRLVRGLFVISDSEQARYGDVGRLRPQKAAETAGPTLVCLARIEAPPHCAHAPSPVGNQ